MESAAQSASGGVSGKVSGQALGLPSGQHAPEAPVKAAEERPVIYVDEQGNPAMSWRFLRARPAGYLTSPLDAVEADTLFETLEIAFDRFELE